MRHGAGDAAALVPHHDDSPPSVDAGRVDVLPLEERAVDGRAPPGRPGQERREFGVVDPDAEDGPHRGLHDLGVEAVGRSGRADDLPDAEPVGQADDRTQIPGVLHLVERQREPVAQPFGVEPVAGDFDRRQRVGRRFEQRQALHLARRDGLHAGTVEDALQRIDPAHAEVRGAQFADELRALGDEQSVLRAAAFVGQRADELYFGFRHGRFSIVKVAPSCAA